MLPLVATFEGISRSPRDMDGRAFSKWILSNLAEAISDTDMLIYVFDLDILTTCKNLDR